MQEENNNQPLRNLFYLNRYFFVYEVYEDIFNMLLDS